MNNPHENTHAAGAKKSTLLMLVSGFPALSETFVVQEAISLSEKFTLRTVSTEREPDASTGNHDLGGLNVSYRETTLTELTRVIFAFLRNPIAFFQSLLLLRHYYPWKRTFSRLYGLARLSAETRASGATLVHAHWRGPTDIAYLQARFMKVPFTIFVHAHDIYDEGLKEVPYKRLFAEKMRAAETVFTCTKQNLDTLKELFPSTNIQLTYHGVNLEKLSKKTRPKRRADVPLRLLSVGRIIAYKGFDKVIDVATRLHASNIDFQWTIIGDGAYRSTLEKEVIAHGFKDRIHVRGPAPHKDVLTAMHNSDLFVFLGRHEQGQYGLPNVLIEAAANGLGIVTTPLPTISELIEHDVSGFVEESPEACAGRIARLAGSPHEIHTVGLRARIFARQHHDHHHQIQLMATKLAALIPSSADAKKGASKNAQAGTLEAA
ncbi:MAG: glycosyltransferase family 4 protein [Pseudomonadota bacterium]